MTEDDLKSYNASHLMMYAMMLMGLSRDQMDQDAKALALRSRDNVESGFGSRQSLVVEKLSF